MIGALVVDVRFPGAQSLKDKRALLRPILETSRTKYRVAVAEVEHQDLLQRSVIEVAAVASAEHVVTEVLDAVERLVWSSPGVEVLTADRLWLETD